MPINTELIGSAFVMGFAGSLHCIGMCGPLALSLPITHKNTLSRISGGLIYNSGRIFSYASMGLLFGTFGHLIIGTRWQNFLSISLGVIILLYLLLPKRYFLRGSPFGHFSTATTLSTPFRLLRQKLGKLFLSKKLSSRFFVGILNGFLPCGLVYLALSSSIISASPVTGSMFMLFFGLGTFPMMFATTLMGNYLNQTIRGKIHKVVPVLLFFMAVLLILRGMNLGVPFISPGINDPQHSHVGGCH